MFVKPLFYQPEVQSFLFLFSNIIILLFTVCFIQSFSFFFLFLYSIIVLYICRKIANGHSYTPPENTDLTGHAINYEFPSSSYDAKVAYGQSKLAQIWHAWELQQRYGPQGINAYSLHPGTIYTELTRRQPKSFELIYQLILILVGKSTYQGAQTSLYCSLSNQAKPGKFHGDCKEAKTSVLAYNNKLAEECWEFSERIISEKTKVL